LDKDKKFTGQPLLSQILSVIPATTIKQAAQKVYWVVYQSADFRFWFT